MTGYGEAGRTFSPEHRLPAHGVPTAAGLGALAVLWYTGICTYLKRVSSVALAIGSVIGAILPAIARIGGDYEQAKFPALVRAMGGESLSRIAFMSATSASVSALLLPIFGLSSSPFLGLGLAVAGTWLTVGAGRSPRAPSKRASAGLPRHQPIRRDGHGRRDSRRQAGTPGSNRVNGHPPRAECE